jgi:DUF1365 family protein
VTWSNYFGYCFNPVSFYYCFDTDGETLQTIVAEVNNTPWGERNMYVLPESMDVGHRGIKRFRPVYMANSRAGRRMFDASINLARTEITGGALASVLARFPFMTVKVIAGIYWQALRLWIKRCPLYPHPGKRQKIAAEAQ